jgi:prepilin-type processing-associated H-X9-DG protein
MAMKRGCLIVGIVSVGLLGGWLVWAVAQAREAVRRSQCVGHLKWIVVTLHNYHSLHGSLPAGTILNLQLPPERRLSWLVELWDTQCLAEKLKVDLSKAWDEPPNWPPKIVGSEGTRYINMTPEDTSDWVTCPDDLGFRARKPFPLTYVGMAGIGVDAPQLPSKHPRAGIFGYERVTTFADISDGTSTTMAVIETTLGHGPWTAGGPPSVRSVDTTTRPYIGRDRPFGGYHAGGANVAFADGSVRFVRETIDPNIFEATATIAGGEKLPLDWTP